MKETEIGSQTLIRIMLFLEGTFLINYFQAETQFFFCASHEHEISHQARTSQG